MGCNEVRNSSPRFCRQRLWGHTPLFVGRSHVRVVAEDRHAVGAHLSFVAMTRIGEGFSLRGNPPPIIVRCSIELPFPTRGEGTITSTAPATPISSPALSRDDRRLKKVQRRVASTAACVAEDSQVSCDKAQLSGPFRADGAIERLGKVVGSWAGRLCAVHSGAKFSDPKETGCQSNTRPA
jgi:hypothetical protein